MNPTSTLSHRSIAYAMAILLAVVFHSPWRLSEATDAITERGFLATEPGALTLPEAREASYRPFQGFLAFGNRREDVWLRLEIRARQQAMVLRFQPAYIEEVAVYHQDGSGQVRETQVGSAVPFASREVQTLTPSVVLDRSWEPQTVFVRVRSATSGVLVDAIPLKAERRMDELLTLLTGVFLGLMLIMLLVSALAWLMTRERVWLAGFVLDLTSLTFNAYQVGVIQKYVFPDGGESVATLGTFLTITWLPANLFLCLQLMKILNVPESYRRLQRGVFLFAPLALIFWLLGDAYTARFLTNIGFIALSLFAIGNFVFARHENPWVLRLYQVLLILFITLPLLWLAGGLLAVDLPASILIYSLAPSNVIFMLMILMLLSVHTYEKMVQRVQLEIERREIAVELEMESRRRSEAVGFLGMIIHEVKNPLNHIRLAVRNILRTLTPEDPQALRLKRVEQSVMSIDHLLERTIQLDAAASGTLPLELRYVEFRSIVIKAQHAILENHRFRFMSLGNMRVIADAEILTLMIQNLMDNALAYSPPESPVELEIQTREGGHALVVRNRVGSAGPPDLSRLFKQSYYQAKPRGNDAGLGLGLFWVHEVARRMGGSLAYHPDGVYVEFSLWLPASA